MTPEEQRKITIAALRFACTSHCELLIHGATVHVNDALYGSAERLKAVDESVEPHHRKALELSPAIYYSDPQPAGAALYEYLLRLRNQAFFEFVSVYREYQGRFNSQDATAINASNHIEYAEKLILGLINGGEPMSSGRDGSSEVPANGPTSLIDALGKKEYGTAWAIFLKLKPLLKSLFSIAALCALYIGLYAIGAPFPMPNGLTWINRGVTTEPQVGNKPETPEPQEELYQKPTKEIELQNPIEIGGMTFVDASLPIQIGVPLSTDEAKTKFKVDPLQEDSMLYDFSRDTSTGGASKKGYTAALPPGGNWPRPRYVSIKKQVENRDPENIAYFAVAENLLTTNDRMFAKQGFDISGSVSREKESGHIILDGTRGEASFEFSSLIPMSICTVGMEYEVLGRSDDPKQWIQFSADHTLVIAELGTGQWSMELFQRGSSPKKIGEKKIPPIHFRSGSRTIFAHLDQKVARFGTGSNLTNFLVEAYGGVSKCNQVGLTVRGMRVKVKTFIRTKLVTHTPKLTQ